MPLEPKMGQLFSSLALRMKQPLSNAAFQTVRHVEMGRVTEQKDLETERGGEENVSYRANLIDGAGEFHLCALQMLTLQTLYVELR